MSPISFEPWSLVAQLQRGLPSSRAPGERRLAWIPSVDVHEERERFVIRADLPGVAREQLELTAHDGVLTIRGERRAAEAGETGRTERAERIRGTFLRRFRLPDTVDATAIAARLVNGVLEVELPKRAQVQPRRIDVQAA